MKDFKVHHTILVVLMILFIVFPIEVPLWMAELITPTLSKFVLYAFGLSLMWMHPVVGTISLVFIYELIHRAETQTGDYQIRKYLPSSLNRDKHLNALNQFPTTLEEEVVQKRIPQVYNKILSPPTYKPMLYNEHQMEPLS